MRGVNVRGGVSNTNNSSETLLSAEFLHASMPTDVKEVAILSTLVRDLNGGMIYLWSLLKNVMTFVQIVLFLMIKRMSADRSVSVLDRAKNKLRNAMNDKRMTNLEMLIFYPGIVENMGMIALCNKLSFQVPCKVRRESLLGKFDPFDTEQNVIRKMKGDKLDTIKIHQHSSLVRNLDEPPPLKFVSVQLLSALVNLTLIHVLHTETSFFYSQTMLFSQSRGITNHCSRGEGFLCP